MQRILMIDDDRTECLMVADYLKPLNYDVTAVHPGIAGVEKPFFKGHDG